jgi:hypothetical protein
VIDCEELDVHVRQRLPKMEARLDSVRGALMLATAEWLRDPAQRVSLLVEEEKLSGWPERDETPLVYLGLFLLFHDWPGHEWTFATYDTVDTHPLRLTSVPRWEQDTGGSGPLARVMGGRTANPRFEHQAAFRLVEHLLAHRDAPPGVPQLTVELSDGATMDWERRQDLLKQILKPDRRPRYPEHSDHSDHSEYEEKHHQPQHQPQPPPRHEPPPQPQHQPQPPYRAPKYEEPQAPYAHPHHLHEDLRDHERGNHMQRSFLMAQLHDLPDEVLLHELRSGELPADSVELLLSELGTHQRRTTRPPEMQHALCAQVLSKHLYLGPHGQPGEHMSGAAQAGRAADLFTWAVAPLARDERYLRDLYELMHSMSRAPHPIGSNWLEQSIISPVNGEVPDLPPTVWRQLLHEALARKERPRPAVPPPPPPAAPESPTPMSRLSELSSNVGCVLGVFFTMIVVLIAIVLIVM